MKAKMYIAKNGFAYRASEDGQSIQFLDTSMNLGWKHSDYMTDKVLKAARPAQEVLDEEAARRGWQPWEEPEEAPTPQSNAVQLAKDVLDAVRHFKGELTADGCRRAVGKSYFSHSGLDTGGYQCSPRGVKLAPKGEDSMDLTWAKFIKFCRGNGLIEEESIKCSPKPAQKTTTAANSPPEDASPQISPTGCTSAPASPADAGAATQSLSAAAPASLEAQPLASSAFDYTGLDVPTVDTLHWAEREICDARRDYVARLAQAVHIAHDVLCGGARSQCERAHNNQHSDDTFHAWCASVGLGKTTAYKLLQVAALLNGSTPEEQAVLESASPSLLYAAAKPSAPAELVQAVKDGDITTHKQYQELLARLKAKDQELAAERADREAERASTSALLADEQQRRQEALRARLEAEKIAREAKNDCAQAQRKEKLASSRADEAERNLAGARDALTAAKARGDRWQEKCEALEAQASAPAIEARVVDPEEVEQLAAEKAEALAAQQMAQRDAEDARAAYDAVILATRSMDAAWQALAPMLPRLAPEEKGQAIHQFVNKLMCIKEDVLKCL